MRFPFEPSVTRLVSTIILAAAVVACGPAVDADDAEDTEGEGAAGSGAADGGEEPKPDLFACELPIDCTLDAGHLGESVTPEMMKCQSDLTLSGEPGVQRYLSVPGPYPTQIESLVVLRGDGTARTPSQSRCASEGACAEQNTTAWRRSVLEHCEVVPAEVDEPSRCGEGEERCVYPSLASCVVLGLDFTCDAAAP